MAIHFPQPLNQFFLHIVISNKPPIDNFEQWAKLVKAQMLASLRSKSRQSLSRFTTIASTLDKVRLSTMEEQ